MEAQGCAPAIREATRKKEKANRSLSGRDEVGGGGHSSHKGMLMRKPNVFWAGDPGPCDCSGIPCHRIRGDLMGKRCWSQITEGTECQPWGRGLMLQAPVPTGRP